MNLNPYEVPSSQPDLGQAAGASNRTWLSACGGFIGIACLGSALGFVIWTASISSGLSFFMVAILGWVAFPFVLLWLASMRIKAFAGKAAIVVILVATAAFGVWAFDAVDEDAQGALVLLFAPAYQLVGVFSMLIVYFVVGWIARRARSLIHRQES
ncbi:hypothetical protein CA13_44890 [Planctomycetes bacterium CA13]|uniref:Uncharacterized protein n=1 Tax=Novipirellula herctigrandis TaxID=2527986 RepID=A0A5C5Z7I9_9BACT|nr:hypothetical protein CA13_44890 [Planctomycetes bacterium CA13]